MGKVKIEFGIMSNKFEVEADNKYSAYSAILLKYVNNPNMVALYTEPYDKDSWMNFDNTTEVKLNEIFKPHDGFENYLQNNKDSILSAFKSIKRLV